MANSSEEPVRPSIHRGLLGRLGSLIGGALVMLMVFLGFIWFVVRVEVPTNHVLVLVNKSGDLLPTELQNELSDQVVLYPELVKKIAARTGQSEEKVRNNYKGVRYEVITEGRQWYNPFSYERFLFPATIIKQNEVGVLIRRFGKPLPFPKTVATEPDERGPVAQTLSPGRHNINPLAYEVQTFQAISIPEGHVGVVTLLSGTDPVRKNSYTVQPGEKGVQRSVLPPGLEYFNPYLKQIDIVDVRSHKYDLVGDDAINFPSGDSFTIRIEGTVEWAIRPDHVAEVTVAYGDTRDILDKIILPNARSLARIQGSKLKAREFISGKTRVAFQDKLLQELREECWTQGVDIKSALVRDIQPPAEIATLISNREQADQEIERYVNQMEEAKAEALLVEQQELQVQNRTLGEMKTEVVTLTKEAEQRKNVAITKANRELAVAKLTVQSAEKDAVAIRSRGAAEGKVILFGYQARAEPLKNAVAAFGDGNLYAQQFFYQKVAPSIQSILANSDGPFADIFKEFASTPSESKGGSH
jgi:regulator of protease activity HflC (stomatin/prohibitin superfamily)